MSFIQTRFPGLLIYEPQVFEDARGYFYESYNESTFLQGGINCRFKQDNQARSSYGVVRGLHFQAPPFAQAKLVRALAGTILDVAVDIRQGSPTFGQTFTLELSLENKKQLFIPQGFAHGYAVLSEAAEVFYKCDTLYHKPAERGLFFQDPALGIDWRVPAAQMILSDKDQKQPLLKDLPALFTFKD